MSHEYYIMRQNYNLQLLIKSKFKKDEKINNLLFIRLAF
ncbi:hypothetical protein KCTC52924_01850 [Arenibacter antarcticus]